MSAPQRLRDDPAIAPELKRDLERCAADDGYDVAAGLARLSTALKNDAPVAATSIASSRLFWFVATGAAGVVMVAALWWWLERDALPASVDPALPVESAPVQSIDAPPSQSPTRVEPHAPPTRERPSPPPARAQGPARRKLAARLKPDAGNPDPAPSLTREVDLIVEARRALDNAPQRTLELTRQLEHEHPTGALQEEREGLAVLALWKLGQREQARARARQFMARYPRSAMRTRMQGIDDGSHK